MTQDTQVQAPDTQARSGVRGWWQRSRDKQQELINEYGGAAIGVYFVLFFGTWFAFWLAIGQGMEPSSVASGAGTIGGAYLATKATQPLRIGATAVLTPMIVAVARRLRRTPA